MPLTASRELDHFVDQQLRTFAIAATTKIFKGSLIGLTTGGFARPLVAGDLFAGIAFEEMDNSTGADGDKKLRVYQLGDFKHLLSGATVADIGAAVYASADDTLTLTATANSFVGQVIDSPASSMIILRIQPLRTAI